MALLSDALKAKQIDVRMVSRGLGRGQLFQKDVDKQLKDLPDEASNAEFVSLDAFVESVAGKSGLRE